MAFVGLQLPPDLATLLESVEVPGHKEKASDYHVTILHIHDVDFHTLTKMMAATIVVAKSQRPFLCCGDSVDTFPPNPEYGYPVIMPVVSQPLMALNLKLRSAFDQAEIPYSKTHPEYKPHVTLARYIGEDAKPYHAELPGLCAWVANDLVIWSDDSTGKASIKIPLTLSQGFLGIASRVASGPRFRP